MGKTNETKEVQQDDMRQLFGRSLLTGFIGGLLLSIIWIGFYYFNFVEFSPRAILLHPWKASAWASGFSGNIITVILISVMSIIIAFLYYISLKKINSLWIGVLYGFIIWTLVFLMIGQVFPDFQITKLEKDTTISTLGLFVLYGAFIGYSISYDFYRIQTDSMLEDDV